MNPEDTPTAALDLGHTRLDVDRTRRIGQPEAIFAAGKTPEQCREIVAALLEDGDDPVIVTRCGPAHLEALSALDPEGTWGGTLTWRHRAPTERRGPVVVLSGGTSDQPVVEECLGTLTASGARTRSLPDVGVAGLHRLLDALEQVEDAEVLVAVAGMEAALATVLAGLAAQPIVAVPTSVGYGTTFDGLTALLSMLSSCAPGVAVVGIDNGYGAACAALRILGPHR
jgi:NCAIR mutase (PurE)-related protein